MTCINQDFFHFVHVFVYPTWLNDKDCSLEKTIYSVQLASNSYMQHLRNRNGPLCHERLNAWRAFFAKKIDLCTFLQKMSVIYPAYPMGVYDENMKKALPILLCLIVVLCLSASFR